MNTKKHETLLHKELSYHKPFLKTLLVFIGLIFVLFSVLGEAYAENNPQVYFQTAVNKIPPNGEFAVRVLVNASQPINAVDVGINYSPEIIELITLNNGKSIIDFWSGDSQSPPRGSVINLQGGSVKPFSGNGGEIITLKFRAKKEGQANLTFIKANLYYADGKGTQAPTEPAGSLKITIVEGAKIEAVAFEGGEAEDRTPPIIETAKVASSPIEKSRLAVFHAVDNESGIKNTEIRFRQWFSWSDWQAATNPVRLPNTAWAFQVKASDNAGNAAEKTVYIPQSVLNIFLPLLLVLLIAIILISILKRRKK